MNAPTADAAPIWPPDPLELIRFLRGAEFRLGTAEGLRAVALLERLAAECRAPRSPEEAALWLAPILCTSARQQAILPERLRTFEATLAPPPPTPPVPNGAPKAEPLLLPPWTRRAAFLAVAVVAALLGYLLYAVFVPSKGDRPRPPPPSEQQGGTAVAWDFAHTMSFVPIAAVPPLVWLLIMRLRRRGRPVLDRAPYDGRASATLRPETRSLRLFGGNLTHAAQGMRAHRRIPSWRPDAVASARATAAAAGYLTP
jgi:hypothetical protein